MKPVDQSSFGENGNCFAACVATILELPIEQVGLSTPTGNTMPADWGPWFEARGLGLLAIVYHLPEMTFGNSGHIPVIALGRSPGGRRHAVVYVGNEMAHDPHPDRRGLVPGSLEGVVFILSERPQPGPQCAGCDEVSKSDNAARAAGWRCGTYQPGEVCWLCRDCWNGQGAE